MKNGSLSRKLVSCLVTIAVFTGFATNSVFAEGSPSVVAIRPNSEGVYVYAIGDPISSMSVQIGDSLTTVQSTDVAVRTMILVDNSISTYEALVKHGRTSNNERNGSTTPEGALAGNIEGDSLVPFLQGIVSQREDNENFVVGTIGENGISWLGDWCADYDAINGAIAGIHYQDFDTSVINGIYDAIAAVPDDAIYTRIVIVSDCVDESTFARTHDEFVALEESKQVELCLIGIETGNNSDDINNVMSLIRTAPRYISFTTSDGSNLNDLYGTLNVDHSIQTFIATPELNIFTGSNVGVLINMTTEFGDFTANGSVRMPINPVTPTPTVTPVPTATPVPTEAPETPTPVPEVVEDTEEEDDNSSMGIVYAFLLILGMGIIFGLFYFMWGRGIIKKKNKGESALSVVQGQNAVKPVPEKKPKRMVSVFKDNDNKPQKKMIDVAIFLALKDGVGIKREEYRQIRFVNDELTIGKDEKCEFCINDSTLGMRHCTFSRRNNGYYLRDLGNANPTTYNGSVIDNTEVMVTTGGVLQIGRESFKVDFRVDEVKV